MKDLRKIFLFLVSITVLLSCGKSQGPGIQTSSIDDPPIVTDNPPIVTESSFLQVFPADNPWNKDISNEPVDPLSSTYINSIGADGFLHPDFGTVWNGAPIGIPYVVVTGMQPKVPISFEYAHESDPGPYPVPLDAPIEGGINGTGDRHVIVVDKDNHLLYELYGAYPDGQGGWRAGSGAIFDLTSNSLRPLGWTSADAAGLPIFPGLVRYDEVVEQKRITHALRFVAAKTQRAFIYPARHPDGASLDPTLPPKGLRLRLKKDYDIRKFPECVQVILTALKKYGMFLADNGTSWMVSGAPDPRWNDRELHSLNSVPGTAFEVVKMSEAPHL